MLVGYKNYLNANGVRLRTTIAYENIVRQFLRFLDSENIAPQSATYKDLLAYVKTCKDRGNVARTLNSKLSALNHYYSWLLSEGIVRENPAAELRVRGEVNRKPHDLLDWEYVESLYTNYPSANLSGKRNKTIVGMLVYQGLMRGELEKLMLEDVDLIAGKVRVPALARSNSRELVLDPVQILQLQNYITQVRPVLSEGVEVPNLFLSGSKGVQLNNVMVQITKQLMSFSEKFKEFNQIRSSVITHWLSRYNIREVQYMIGHRYLSSTEHYRTDVLESLQDQIDTLHPLN